MQSRPAGIRCLRVNRKPIKAGNGQKGCSDDGRAQKARDALCVGQPLITLALDVAYT